MKKMSERGFFKSYVNQAEDDFQVSEKGFCKWLFQLENILYHCFNCILVLWLHVYKVF